MGREEGGREQGPAQMSGDEDDDQGERDWSQRPTRRIPGDTVQDMGGEGREREGARRGLQLLKRADHNDQSLGGAGAG
jgi:hypothetical protein